MLYTPLVSAERQKQLRACFSVIFMCLLMIQTLWPLLDEGSQIYLDNDACMLDYTFEWTAAVNTYFRHSSGGQKAYQIFSQYLMDAIFLSCVGNWMLNHRTTRMAFCIMLYYFVRGKCQNSFYLTRYDGYMYDNPGVPSLTIAYFNTNDFYFSGHIGSCTIYTMEFFAVRNYKLFIFGLLVTCNQWVFLTFFRSHYVIDMITAVPVAMMCHRAGELGAYLIDVLIF
jgi:hypothetical protein